MSDKTQHTKQADIEQASIGEMVVEGEPLHLSATPEAISADDTADRAQLIALGQIAADVKRISLTSESLLKHIISEGNANRNRATKEALISAKESRRAPSAKITQERQAPKSAKETNGAPQRTELAPARTGKAISGLSIEPTGSARKRRKALNRDKEGHEGTQGSPEAPKRNSPAKAEPERQGPKSKETRPKKTRESRTIDLEPIIATRGKEGDLAQQSASPVPAQSAEQTGDARKPDAVQDDRRRGGGFYLGADGRVRRPDGTFATKVEVRRFQREQSGASDDTSPDSANKYTHSLTSLLVRGVALLAGKNGLAGAKGLSHSSAGETAGLAAGGSFFYAMREVTDLASDVSEAMKERNIKGAKDLIPYLRQRASSLNPFKRDKAEGDNQPTGAPDSAAIAPDAAAPASGTGKRRAPSIRRTEPAASDAANVAGRPGAAEHAESISESETTITSERQAQRDSQTTSERQTASQSREEKRVDSSTSAEAASERQTTGEVKSTQQTETVRDRESVSNVEVARGTEAQQGGDTAKAKGSPAAQEATSAEAHRQGVLVDTIEQEGMDHADLLERQHGELLEKLDDLIDSNKPKSPGLVDSAMDLAGDAWGRRRGKSRGKHARARQPRSEASPSSRRDGARARRAPEPGSRPAGRIARVKAAMPRIFSPAASPLVAASATGGAMASTAGVAGSRAIGAGAAAMGARAIPVAGQLLALGMAGYDAYQGFNDKDAQSRAFGLQGNQKATTGQKSAMAAANVLDLGGLTSGLAGLLGSAAGALGFERLQESLTFDTEDMARAIYDGMTMFDHKNPLKDNGNKSIVNNYGSSGVTYRGTTPVTGEWQGTPVRYNGIEAENGLPANFLGATSMVESGGNPNAYNKKSGAMGEFQFMPKTAAGLGLANAFDQKSSTEAMIKHTKQNQAYFRKQMGREATGRELYLLHQQGMGGGTGLIKALQQNPNASAVEALAANGQKAPVQAVLQNGGRTDMTVQEFTDLILNKYDRAEVAEILKKKTGKTEDAKAILNDEKPAYDVPMMLRGGPRDGETAPPLVSQTEQPASVSTSSTTTTTAAPVTQALAPPMTLRPVVDIQEEQARRAMTEPKPYAPVVDETAKMAKTLQNIERLLAEQNKQQKSSPTGAPMRTGGRAIPADHPTRSPQMEAFASDR